jgi:hypothetical protein
VRKLASATFLGYCVGILGLGSAVADPLPLQILVDTDVRVASDGTPRRVVEALRRQLRQHDAASVEEVSTALPALLQTREGQHLMPQGLLPKVTETCRRHGVPFAVVDRRAMVSCPPLRARLPLDEQGQEALRRLLLRDSGVVIVPEEKRCALVAEMIARRQQRTLVAVEGSRHVEDWLGALRRGLSLPESQIQPLRRADAETRVVVGRCEAIARLPHPVLRKEYGLVVFDAVSRIDALTLMKTIRAVGARYLLGLADGAQRSDGLHGPILLALGGVVHALRLADAAQALRLSCCFGTTEFDFPYGGRQQYQALVAALALDAPRAQLIVADVEREARAGRACLVLSERRDHLEQLAMRLPGDIAVETLTSTVHPAERSRVIARFEAGTLHVLLATGQIAAEAVTTPRVERLFLTFPFSYARKLEAPVRSLLTPSAGQPDAVLYDYDDPRVPPLHRAFAKRREFLLRLSREVDAQLADIAQLDLPLD